MIVMRKNIFLISLIFSVLVSGTIFPMMKKMNPLESLLELAKDGVELDSKIMEKFFIEKATESELHDFAGRLRNLKNDFEQWKKAKKIEGEVKKKVEAFESSFKRFAFWTDAALLSKPEKIVLDSEKYNFESKKFGTFLSSLSKRFEKEEKVLEKYKKDVPDYKFGFSKRIELEIKVREVDLGWFKDVVSYLGNAISILRFINTEGMDINSAERVSKFSNLEELEVVCDRWTPFKPPVAFFDYLKGIKKLKSLKLINLFFKEDRLREETLKKYLKGISGIKGLESLYIPQFWVPTDKIGVLKDLRLTSLTISVSPIPKPKVKDLVDAFPLLRELKIISPEKKAEPSFAPLSKLNFLESLNIPKLENAKNLDGLKNKVFKKLKIKFVGWEENIEKGIKYIPSMVEKLYIDELYGLSEKGLTLLENRFLQNRFVMKLAIPDPSMDDWKLEQVAENHGYELYKEHVRTWPRRFIFKRKKR
jgi:hypothetical protein